MGGPMMPAPHRGPGGMAIRPMETKMPMKRHEPEEGFSHPQNWPHSASTGEAPPRKKSRWDKPKGPPKANPMSKTQMKKARRAAEAEAKEKSDAKEKSYSA